MLTSLQLCVSLCLVDFNMIEMCINPRMCLRTFLDHDQDCRINESKIYYFIYTVSSLILILQGQYVLYSIQLGSTTSSLVD